MTASKKILIIDDEEQFREIFGKRLEAEGFIVETAENGMEGLRRAKENPPDIILLDVAMQGLDGIETLEKFKADPAAKNLKIAFLTAIGGNAIEEERINNHYAHEFGAMGYIKK